MNSDGELEGDLAETWEVSPDNLTIIAHLDPGAGTNAVSDPAGRPVAVLRKEGGVAELDVRQVDSRVGDLQGASEDVGGLRHEARRGLACGSSPVATATCAASSCTLTADAESAALPFPS